MKPGKDGGDETLKKIKETLMAAAFSLAFSDCRNDANCSMALDNLDIEGFTMARVYMERNGYTIMCDRDHSFSYFDKAEGNNYLTWGNEDFQDINMDGHVDIYVLEGPSINKSSPEIDSRYSLLLSGLRQNQVHEIWERWRNGE